MIQTQHLTQYPTPEVYNGIKLTQPGQSVDIKRALQQYRMGSMEERAAGYYEKEGMPIPDFDRLSKVERLVALTKYRELIKEKNLELNTLADASRKRKEDAILQDKVDKKVKDELKKSSTDIK